MDEFERHDEQAEPEDEVQVPFVPPPSASSAPTEDTSAPSSGSILTGTSSELEHGVGGTGDHPAPAVMLDGQGALHSAGEPPAGNVASGQAPAGDSFDLQSGDLSPEAKEALANAPHEHPQIQTDRPDIGTP